MGMGRVKGAKNIQAEDIGKKLPQRRLTLEEHLRNLAEVLVERIMEEQQSKKGAGYV